MKFKIFLIFLILFLTSCLLQPETPPPGKNRNCINGYVNFECGITAPNVTTNKLINQVTINSSHIYTNYIDFNTSDGYTTQEGRIGWNPTDGTLNVGMQGGNVNLQVGQEQLIRVINDESFTIYNGKIVYVSGSTGDLPKVKLASASVSNQARSTWGMATENIEAGKKGYVTTIGMVRDIDTNNWTAGSPVYLSGPGLGNLKSTRPQAPNMTVFIGVVIRKHATEGIIYVRPSYIEYLQFASNVNATNLATNQILYYNSTRRLWLNRNQSLKNDNDVQITSPQKNDILVYNTTVNKWKNSNNLNLTGNLIVSKNLHVDGNFSAKRPYWSGYDNSTQNFKTTTAAQVMNLSNNNDYDSYLISIVNRQNITFKQTGDYLLSVSPQFYQSSGTNKLISFWLQKKEGAGAFTDIPWTNSRYTILNQQYNAPAILFQFDIENPATDMVRVMWYSDSTATQIISISGLTSPTRPGVPGVIISIQKISELTED